MTDRTVRPLSEITAKPTFRSVDGVSIRFVESDTREADALLLSPWPETSSATNRRGRDSRKRHTLWPLTFLALAAQSGRTR